MGDVIDLAKFRLEREQQRERQAEQEAALLRAMVEAQAKLLELAEQIKREREEANDESDPT